MKIKKLLLGLPILLLSTHYDIGFAQETKSEAWDLNRCLNYALEHNIQVNKKKLQVQSSELDLTKAKAERLPTLNASLSESFTNTKDQTAGSSGNWNVTDGTSATLSSGLTLYNGGTISNTIRQSNFNVEIANLDIEVTKNSITLSITQAYLNVLYANESVNYANEVLASSLKQVERGRELIKAGSIAKSDLVQLEAQYASDKYSLVVAENTLISNTTNLKQLLEIPVTESFSVTFPEIKLENEFNAIPTKEDAFNTSLSIMPEIKQSSLNEKVSELDLKIAKAGYLPSLSMNANYTTDFSGQKTNSFANQINKNQMQRVGLTLNIPVFNRFSTKTKVQRSVIAIEQTSLASQETKKNLLQTVENVYQNTVAGKSRYDAAEVQFSSANESYKISEEQFNLGMLNSVDLLKVKNSLLSAQKELVQSKYSAILNRKILDFYMGKAITL